MWCFHTTEQYSAIKRNTATCYNVDELSKHYTKLKKKKKRMKRDNSVSFDLYERLRIRTFLEIESKLVVTRAWW